jgi:hypothetical protein
MLLSLLNSAITVLNAAGFLLMAAGPELLEYIVVSSIFSVASLLYSWLLPAAIAYDPARMGHLRLMQFITVGIASFIILYTHSSLIGFIFTAMMLIEAAVFPGHMLLFRSRTQLFIRSELVRSIANSAALLVTLAFFGGSPQSYVLLLLINVACASLLLMATRTHLPPSLIPAPPSALFAVGLRQFWSRQLLAMLMARGLETSALIGLSRIEALSPVLSLKIGMSLSSALSMNARNRPLPLLIGVHMLVYTGGTAFILLLQRIKGLTLPETLLLISPMNALTMLPVILVAFVLNIVGLRLSASKPAALGEP